MNLFETTSNLLPEGGTVVYYGKVVSEAMALNYYEIFLHRITWKNDEAVIYGKHYVTKRKVAWYGDKNFSYTYSNTTRFALPWTKELVELKTLSEEITGATYNSCLLNLYHSGEEGMAWHSDDEKALSKNGAIASWSFGAERKFFFKHKQTEKTVSVVLENGSLLVMKDETQANWRHRLPPTTKVKRPRVNLTFRTMVE
jgi:alkylated DNA repair dioxygenase AlkB